MKLIKLKEDKFIYIDKSYIQNRFINEDKTIFITQDNLDFIKVYTGNDAGKAVRIYLKENEDEYPFYTTRQVIEHIAGYRGTLKPIIINQSHYKGKMSKLNKFRKAIKRLSE